MTDTDTRRTLICELTEAARQLDKTVDTLARQVADLAGVPPDSDEITDLIWNGGDLHAFCKAHLGDTQDD